MARVFRPEVFAELEPRLTAIESGLAGVTALIRAQREIDTTTTPWALVLRDRATGAELVRWSLYDEHGEPVTSVSTFIAAQLTPGGE